MVVLPPGTLLQHMYLKRRLNNIPIGRFIEIGPGSGEITRILLESGWYGTVYDFESETIAWLRQRFANEVAEGRLETINASYFESMPKGDADLVISCMVMEHLDDQQQLGFMQHSKACLNESGRMIGLVPASPRHWGIEDDIAGHFRRYTRASLAELMQVSGWRLENIAGLTYPVSNILLPLSNYLVNRQEHQKLLLATLERTKQSGKRQVKFKTHFPPIFRLLLNEIVLMPMHILQRWFSKSENCLVLYFEAVPSIS